MKGGAAGPVLGCGTERPRQGKENRAVTRWVACVGPGREDRQRPVVMNLRG